MTSQPVLFLIFFLPIFFVLYYLIPRPYKNAAALLGSLLFYSWGHLAFLPLILALILANFFLAPRIERNRSQPDGGRRVLAASLVLNLGVLLFFKILSVWGGPLADALLPKEPSSLYWFLPVPFGLSYVIFQLISYQADTYNEQIDHEKSLVNFGLYVLLFPKIAAGPITRYRDLAPQMVERATNLPLAAGGAQRFILGLAKKVLIADTLARLVNPVFSLESPSFAPQTAWLVLIAFSMQLYFDFSGYSDIAIGLGQMLGFRFAENFQYPYISKSISEFWRRWHMTLSSWFRDYVFYPLEHTRRRADRWRQSLHVVIIFLLTGLWHGLTLNFMIWGLIHGLATALEMSSTGRSLKKLWPPLQHSYALIVVLISWVFFRSPSLAFTLDFFRRLGGWQAGAAFQPDVDGATWAALAAGLVFSVPVYPALQARWQRMGESSAAAKKALLAGSALGLLILLAFSFTVITRNQQALTSIYSGF